jgi:ATP-dependent RNA helicase RhlE
LSAIRHFVLDEVDTMLNLGFMDDVQRVINLLPKDRQTLLFSATIPPEISALAQAILKDPEKIVVSPKVKTAVGVSQELYWVGSDHKLFLLSYILKIKGIDSAFIFTSTKSSADKIAQTLSMQGFPAEAIHSDRTQRERGEVLERFKSRDVRYLVATDVVARGIDIDGISYVINLELPQEPENYIHRIGRTARAGAEGVAITLCDPKHQDKIKQIEKLIDQKIPVISTHPFINSVRKFLLKK